MTRAVGGLFRHLRAPEWFREARRTGNPLLRPPSRSERVVATLGVAAFVALTAFLAVLPFQVYARGSAVEGAQAHRSSITATVDSPPTTSPATAEGWSPVFASVTYSWHGLSQHGITVVDGNEKVGTQIPVWIDADGFLTDAPRGHTQTQVDAIATALLALCLLPVIGFLGRLGYRRWLLRRRCSLWDDEWLRFVAREPGFGGAGR
jgi:hypothetical protein